MRLSWNEIRARASAFSEEWKNAHYEKGETQSFYEDFFRVFGVKRRSVAVYERRVEKLTGNTGFIDLFWPQVLLVEQKSRGKDLHAARTQAEDYFLSLKEAERPRYILACDFQNFDLYDLEENTEVSFKLGDLADHVERFGFVMGVQKVAFKDQDPVNIQAAELVGHLHDKLEEAGFKGTDLERFLVRIVFCLFADDTGVFQPRNLFLEWLEARTSEDGHDLGAKLAELFQTLDTPEAERGAHLDEELKDFPYVNGDLFNGATRIPAFNSEMRDALIAASRFDWSPISPAIFGSLFQSVMDTKERRKSGAHYTTEKNILKVIKPLFLDELWEEFEAAKAKTRGRRQALDALQAKLGNLTFFDPACGCGNFLIISYREIRRLEIEILKASRQKAQLELDAAILSKVDVDQFYGIEIGEFAAEIARAAMWMMDHIMNNELSRAFGYNYARIPLKKSANIIRGDALELDWSNVVSAEHCDYIFGNPPFIGAKYQEDLQRQQVRDLAKLGGTGGTLDYVCAWFLKAGGFINRATRPRHIAFVSTNSITQGEQVAQLWPIIFDRLGLEISFGHRTFAWGSDARGKAHVHVVIIGLSKSEHAPKKKRLFSYQDINGEPHETIHNSLSPLLIDASNLSDPHITVESRSTPLNAPGQVIIGSKPIDGGHYIFSGDERAAFLKSEPNAARFLRPYVGAQEFLNGGDRWILALQDASPTALREMPLVAERVKLVREKRLASKSEPTKQLAETPTLYHVNILPSVPFLVIPKVSSERREYAPIGWITPPTIPSDLLFVVQDATKSDFAVLQSAIHMGWLRTVGGRLKSDYRYSVGMVYNTFPWPVISDASKRRLADTAQAILDTRMKFPDATLADLYDPNTMPPELKKAHRKNDLLVDKLYRSKGFESERERVEYLLELYEKLRCRGTDESAG